MDMVREIDLPLPYLTPDIPGTGGVIKQYDEDFVVEEIPRYAACGKGTHVYFTIEKRGLTTMAAIRAIAKALDRRQQDIGYAGLKDAHGITRQRMSVEHVDPSVVASLELGRIKILTVTRHTNKLKLGHLAGNGFIIKIRDANPDSMTNAEQTMDVLASRGVPNYFGPQRFGARGDNAGVGRAVLCDDYGEALAIMLGRPNEHDRPDVRQARELVDTGDWEGAVKAWPAGFGDSARVCLAMVRSQGNAKSAWRSVNHSLRKLYISSVQSELFNCVLAGRIAAIDRLQTGDLAWKHANGATFQVENPALEQPRCDAFEISATGPLFGRKMSNPEAEPGRVESQILSQSGLSVDQLHSKDGAKLDGARRPLRVPLGDPQLEAGQDDRGSFLQLCFSLPAGAYATNVTREVCK